MELRLPLTPTFLPSSRFFFFFFFFFPFTLFLSFTYLFFKFPQVDFSSNTNSTTNPQKAPYWIIMLDPNYEWAVVWGCQYGIKSMFILNYKYSMEAELYNQITAQAQEITGFDTSTLVMTPQGYPCSYDWLYE